jgi:hypothetical protein
MMTVGERFFQMEESERLVVMDEFGYSTEKRDYKGFIAWIKQENKGLDLMWFLVDPTNPLDPTGIV